MASPAAALTFQARLESDVSSARSKVDDPVMAISISPIVVNGRVVATAGCKLPGRIVESLRPRGINAREVVALEFARLVDGRGATHPVQTLLVDVDNARETVDARGRILGLAPVEKKPDDPVDVLRIAARGIPIMQAMFSKLTGKGPPQINYHPGVEITLRLASPWTKPAVVCGAPPPPSLRRTEALTQLVNAQPLRSFTKSAVKPADLTNLMFVGSRDLVVSAFEAAGWKTADAASVESSARTFLAVASGQGYKEGPVSLQLLDNKPPDLVFQKQFNTFAKRHHLRIWQRSGSMLGGPVWLAAATHDTGIVMSSQSKWFTHGINADLDAERAKIANDLAFAGVVQSMALVPRPKVPKEGKNASGELIRTDGRMAVLVLKRAASK